MKCKYCHKPVGLFSSKHKECELKHFALLSEIKEILLYKFESSELLDYLKLKQELSEIIANGYVTDKDFDGIVFEIMNMIFSGNCKINNFLFPVFLFLCLWN